MSNTRINADYPISDKPLVDTIEDKYAKIGGAGGNLPMFDAVSGELIDSGYHSSQIGTGGGGTDDHSLLTNRDIPDQHTTSSITGLDNTLINKVNTSDLIDISTGVSDSGKPIKLDANGKISASMVDISGLQIQGDFTPEIAQEYPSGYALNWAWYIKGGDYTWTTGDLIGLTYSTNDTLIYTSNGWVVNVAVDSTNYYDKGEIDTALALKLDTTGKAADSDLLDGNDSLYYATQTDMEATEAQTLINTNELTNKANINGDMTQIFRVATPIDSNDAVTKAYADSLDTGGTTSADLNVDGGRADTIFGAGDIILDAEGA